MKKTKKKKRKNKLKKLFILIIILFILIFSLKIYNNVKKMKILNSLESEIIDINEYILYGTHLNIKGTLNKEIDNIKDVNIVLKSPNEEIVYDTSYTNNKKIVFNTSSKINKGINLEKLNTHQYFILLKIVLKDSSVKYYTLSNKTKYKDLTYYTLTKNNSNNKITIDFNKYKHKPYMFVNVKKEKLPKDVYDIVIDAGHGGNDTGASSTNYTESELTLKYALSLKENLESKGYKIKLTRDKDITLNSYGKNGRAVIPQEVKAKYVFSIHLNSSEVPISIGGIEVYAPSNCNLDLATSIANNIVDMANTNYSRSLIYKIKNGVYVKTFSDNTINESKQIAYDDGYKPYNITSSTPYMYMIRETGGIATNAYVDGRNKKYDANPYYDSNIGIEAYLLELGYIINSNDLNNLLNNQNKYINAITKSIDDHIKNNS